MSNRRWVLGALAVVAAVVVVTTIANPEVVEVELGVVERDTLSVTVVEEGRTRARDRYVVAAPTTGRLARARVREGDPVGVGDELTTLAPPPQDASVLAGLRAELSNAEARAAAAEAELTTAAAHAEQARRELDRRRPLFEMGAIPRETLERFEQSARDADRVHDAASAAAEAARATVREVAARLDWADAEGAGGRPVSVRAPVAGRVLRVYEESDRVVMAGTPLFEIADVGGLEVVVDLPTEEAVRIEPGAAMAVRGWGGDDVLTGTVRRVEPSAFTEVSALGVEEQRVNVIADLDAPPNSLGDGFRLEAEIVVWRGADVLTVPSAALFQDAGGWAVFVARDGRAAVQNVVVGQRGPERAEVLDGLEEGDVVVLYPSDLVGEGVRIGPRAD